MRRVLPLIALLLAGCASQPQTPVSSDDDKTSQAFSTYMAARFAADDHDHGQAAHYYGQALSEDPGNASLLGMSFFYSTTSGDFEAAGKYAQAVVAVTPDDRAARLALAVIDFKHKDYADVRRQLALSAKGPFTTLTTSLFDEQCFVACFRTPRTRAAASLSVNFRLASTGGIGSFRCWACCRYR